MDPMENTQNQKYALITGGASGLGRAFCCHLARQGWHVAITDINLPGAEETLALIVKQGGTGQVELLDVADFAAWQTLIMKLRGTWPRMDLLVNNAGICGAGLVGESSLDDFRRILDVNLFGAIYGCQTCVPWLRETAQGSAVVNIASLATVLSAPAMSAYNISKAGLVSFSETLYGELFGSGIHVTVVLPGFFASNLVERGRFEDKAFKQIAEAYTRSAEFTTDDVVTQTMWAIERKKLYVILGFRARTAARLKRLAPAWFFRVVARTFEKDRQKVLRDGCS